MQDFVRGEALEQLHHAWRDAALGASDQAQRQMSEALDLLDHIVTKHSESGFSVQAARGYIEDARRAVAKSDPLSFILAVVAAMKELEPRAPSE